MKDYYKVLGVKETASIDEIRGRWVELVRELHPDQGGEVSAENEERVREINEAYQVLKHSSTRVEYDLTKAFEGRQSSFKKWFLPVSAVIVLVVVGVGIIYFSRPNDSSVSGSMVATTEVSRSAGQSGAVREEASREEPQAAKSRTSAGQERVAATEERDGLPDKTGNAPRVQQVQANKTVAIPASEPGSPPASKPSPNPARQVPPRTAKAVTHDIPSEITETGLPTIKENTATPAPPAASEGVPGVTGVSPREATSVIAEEGEIREFLADYKQRYTQKDPIAFMRLFSSGAVQNQNQKMDDIRYIYQMFFDQSQDLQYDMEETSIEIYENAAEVKARFKINQTLKRNGEKRFWKGPIRWVLVKEDAGLKIGMLDYQLTK